MEFAKLIARRSTCKRLQVDTVITTTDYLKVLAVAYPRKRTRSGALNPEIGANPTNISDGVLSPRQLTARPKRTRNLRF